jgi:hypothetical protein
MPAGVEPGRFTGKESARLKGCEHMDARGRLAVVQEQAATVGREVMANEGWLAGGFLSDKTFTPNVYLAVAERQKELQRTLLALTACLLSERTPPLVA